MKLILECDLGRDPDDMFAILYLVAAGVDIKAITISPGDKDQIAVAKFLCKELGLDIPIGAGKLDRNKTSSGGVHYELLEKYGHPLSSEPDGLGSDIIAQVMKDAPMSELFAIGPLTSVGGYLRSAPDFVKRGFSRVTMQGGFVSYDLYDRPDRPIKRLAKFEGINTCPTFNLNGDIKGAEALLASDSKRAFVGKNVCHTIIFNHETQVDHSLYTPKNRAMELFQEAMGLYLDKNEEKKFHDPTAAVCHLHPEIGTWFKGGELYRAKGGWGTKPGGKDNMLVDIDRKRLWQHIFEGN